MVHNCRCRVRALSERDMQRKRLTVESTEGKLSEVDVPLAGGGTARVTRYSDPSLPGGSFQPDPGFSNNPAQSVWMPRLADKPRDLSRAFVREAVQGPQFKRFVEARGQMKGEFPVAVLTEDAQAALKAGPSTVYLSDYTLTKQVDKHPEIGLADYLLLPDIIDYGRAYREGEQHLIYLMEDDMVYRAALKATESGEGLYLLSLVRTTRQAAEREVAGKTAAGKLQQLR